MTLVFSRHQYVYLAFRQDLDALIAGMEAAWEWFGGATRRLIVDNMKAAVVKIDRYEPVFNRTFQEYSPAEPAMGHEVPAPPLFRPGQKALAAPVRQGRTDIAAPRSAACYGEGH